MRLDFLVSFHASGIGRIRIRIENVVADIYSLASQQESERLVETFFLCTL